MSPARTHHRRPVAAGRFYDAVPKRCAAEAERLCRPLTDLKLPEVIHGALVPHAGWSCSGRVAGGVFSALAAHSAARTFVMTGSVHTIDLAQPATDSAEAWETPVGPVAVDGELRDAITALNGFACIDAAHAREHSLEVQLPLMRSVYGENLAIVPCLVPPLAEAARWGRALGRLLRRWPTPVMVIASSDLTHYGRGYGFTPRGEGAAGHHWARATNDRELLELIEAMKADEIVSHSVMHRSACGGGSIAATVAACKELGATRGVALGHTDSSRELGEPAGASDSVGYAGVVFG